MSSNWKAQHLSSTVSKHSPLILGVGLGLTAEACAVGGGATVTADPPKHFDLKDKMPSEYSVELQDHKDQQADDADASLTMDRSTLNEIIGGKLKVDQGVTDGKIKLHGKPEKFEEFVGLLDTFDPWYQVVMPIGTK
jgi:putative sterol carrier protein